VRSFLIIAVAYTALLLVGCGLLNKMAADSGNERANTPEGRDLAAQADRKAKDWIDYLLYGLLPAGYGLGRAHQHRRHKKAAAKAAA